LDGDGPDQDAGGQSALRPLEAHKMGMSPSIDIRDFFK
jgi:hypothetical protein